MKKKILLLDCTLYFQKLIDKLIINNIFTGAKIMEKLTRQEIEKRLEILRKSRLNEESFYITRPAVACCYSIVPKLLTRNLPKCVCDICGKEFSVNEWELDEIEPFAKIVERFCKIGVEAKLIRMCYECAKNNGGAQYSVLIRAEGENCWHTSFPKIDKCMYNIFSEKNKNYCLTSKFEYELVLKFLTFQEKIEDLNGFFDNLYNVVFRKRNVEFYVVRELIKQHITEPLDSDFKKEFSEKLREIFGDKYKLIFNNKYRINDKIIINDPELFNSGKKPIDFYAEKSLTVSRALELIKQHILADTKENAPVFKSFLSLYRTEKSLDISLDPIIIHLAVDPKLNANIFNDFMRLFYAEFNELTYKGIHSCDSVRYSNDAGFIKTQIDIVLYKVLGLNVVYDMEEVRQNINYVFKQAGLDKYVELAFAILAEMNKQEISALEFPVLVKEICNKLNCKTPII